jgi:L-lactate dehydrogenase complex protein LldG
MVERTRMTERENILVRVREALQNPAPLRHESPTQRTGTPRSWLPKAGGTFEERLSLFQSNAIELKADFQLLADRAELGARIGSLQKAGNWKRIASHRGELAEAACQAAGLPVLRTDPGYSANELEACDAGITECDALIAQTGSVLVTSRSAGGRALSVLPPHHVIIARRNQLLPDLPAAFELLKQKYAPDYPGFISLITGPSRTGDIERILVLGAHGPEKLTIFCL